MDLITLSAELVFPTEYLRVAPPVPDRRERALSLTWHQGRLFVWFSDWDIRSNDPEEGDEVFESMLVEAEFTEYPTQLLALAEPESTVWGEVIDWVRSNKHQQAYQAATNAQYRGQAQIEWESKRKELSAAAKAAASRWLSDDSLGEFLRESAKELNAVIRRLLEFLRIKHGQSAIPDPPRFTWRQVYFALPGGVAQSLSGEAVDEWLNVKPNSGTESLSSTLSLVEWPQIASALQAGWKPGLVDILLANARTECSVAFGNPRLAVIEAITALEIIIKRVMHVTLVRHDVSKSAIDRIVRETPMGDLVGIWLRPYIPQSEFPTLEKCAEAIRDRNELIHHERRSLSFKRAVEHVSAVTSLIKHLDVLVHQGDPPGPS